MCSCCFGCKIDRSQSVFYFVPQENRLIRRPLWTWKNLGETNFHWQDGPLRAKKRPNRWGNMPIELWDLSNFFSFTIVAVRVTFLKVVLKLSKNVLNGFLQDPSFIFLSIDLLSHCDIVERYFATINGGNRWQNKRNFDQNFVLCRCIFWFLPYTGLHFSTRYCSNIIPRHCLVPNNPSYKALGQKSIFLVKIQTSAAPFTNDHFYFSVQYNFYANWNN